MIGRHCRKQWTHTWNCGWDLKYPPRVKCSATGLWHCWEVVWEEVRSLKAILESWPFLFSLCFPATMTLGSEQLSLPRAHAMVCHVAMIQSNRDNWSWLEPLKQWDRINLSSLWATYLGYFLRMMENWQTHMACGWVPTILAGPGLCSSAQHSKASTSVSMGTAHLGVHYHILLPDSSDPPPDPHAPHFLDTIFTA